MRIPFIRPKPPNLSEHLEELRAIERSGIFSNFGPVNIELERALTSTFFEGIGNCVALCNATIGLILAIHRRGLPNKRYALMPSFTFAATAQAAEWCGYTPLFYDVDDETWLPSSSEATRILRSRAGDIGIWVPYATFGASLPLAWYEEAEKEFGVPVVVDAAASLGTKNFDGRGFGTGCALPIIYSMHVTKTFGAAEGGFVYCATDNIAADIRSMANFGFATPRTAMMRGLNGKLSEIAALVALIRVKGFEDIVLARESLLKEYRSRLPNWNFQRKTAMRQAHQFCALLLPRSIAHERDGIVAELEKASIGSARYFSPHLAEHPHFSKTGEREALPITEDISGRCLSLPLFDGMTIAMIDEICGILRKWY
jgi:dTDP-4-amino-4,6-dideoxygalactose transaminase